MLSEYSRTTGMRSEERIRSGTKKQYKDSPHQIGLWGKTEKKGNCGPRESRIRCAEVRGGVNPSGKYRRSLKNERHTGKECLACLPKMKVSRLELQKGMRSEEVWDGDFREKITKKGTQI